MRGGGPAAHARSGILLLRLPKKCEETGGQQGSDALSVRIRRAAMRPPRSLLAMISASAILCAASAGTAAAQTVKPWRNGILEAKADAGFIMMADRGGFAEKRGLKMDTVQVKAGATLTKALLAGELESAESGAGESILPAARGADVKMIGCSWPGLPQVVMAKAEIKTPQDLKGRIIGI